MCVCVCVCVCVCALACALDDLNVFAAGVLVSWFVIVSKTSVLVTKNSYIETTNFSNFIQKFIRKSLNAFARESAVVAITYHIYQTI